MKDRVLLLLIISSFVLALATGYSEKVKYSPKYAAENDAGEEDYSWIKHISGGKNWRRDASDEDAPWLGRWMPSRPGDPTPPPKVIHQTGVFHDPDAGVEESQAVGMGQMKKCDDGQTNLGVDWNWSPVNYTCYDRKIIPDYSNNPIIYCEHIPSSYVPIHKCMVERIEYDDDIPIYGSHRPVWPVYGEYKFLPKQRWIHSLEHGGIVMLYHPCANPLEVKRLKKLVTGCLRRHIISPYTLLDEERPLALLSWGCRLTMSYVNPSVVQQFIRNKALRGPETISRDGAFSEYLAKPAKMVTDKDDTTLCPLM